MGRQDAPVGGNGLPILRSLGNPILFDSRGNGLNLGVANAWVTLFDLSADLDRVFIGLSIYNPDAAIPVYLAFEQAPGAEVKSIVIEPSETLSLDELSFGPGYQDKTSGKFCKYVRAMAPTTKGAAATGTITYAANPTSGMNVLIGANTYQFVTALGAVAPAGTVYVLIGASANASWTNLKNAIIASDLLLTSSINTGTGVVTVKSLFAGTGPNAYVFADGGTPTGETFTGGGTLGGSGSTAGTAGIVVDSFIW